MQSNGDYCEYSIYCVVSPATHCRHIGIMTPSASSSASGRHTYGFRSITFEKMHHFHLTLEKGKESLNTGQVRKGRSLFRSIFAQNVEKYNFSIFAYEFFKVKLKNCK